MNQYKLLTPGPLTTTDTVKAVMQVDHCTWDDDYKQITQRIRAQLLALGHVAEPAYTAVLMQGSGTFGVESVLTTVVGPKDKVLIAANGAYGLRMTDICRHAGVLAGGGLGGEHPHFHRLVAEGDLDLVSLFDGVAGLGRLAVYQDAARVGHLVGHGAPLDEPAHFQVFVDPHTGSLLIKNADKKTAPAPPRGTGTVLVWFASLTWKRRPSGPCQP